MYRMYRTTYWQLCLVLIFCLLIIIAGCDRAAAPEPTPTPVPVSAADLLADALKYYEAGDYDEAIIAYLGVIEIAPKNFDAQLGLGKAYRSAGKAAEAEAALLAAWEIEGGNREAAYELSYLYLESGKYEEAETVAASFWDTDQENAEIGIALVLSLAGQGKTEELQTLLRGDENLQDALLTVTEEDIIYIGEYNESGHRSGNGVALYSGGYVYVGQYANGQRSGQGTWYCPPGAYFFGTWADDLPNGTGELILDAATGDRKTGTWENGLEHGKMESWNAESNAEYHSCGFIHWKYQAINGVPQVQGEFADGTEFYSMCQGCGNIGWTGTSTPLGIWPFTEQYEQKPIGTSAEG